MVTIPVIADYTSDGMVFRSVRYVQQSPQDMHFSMRSHTQSAQCCAAWAHRRRPGSSVPSLWS